MKFIVAIRTVTQRHDMFVSLLQRLVEIEDGSIVGVRVSASTVVTPNENACRALEMAADTDADWILFLEDDAGIPRPFLRNMKRWLLKHQNPDVHIYPMGCAYSGAWGNAKEVWQYHIKDYYCSVAFLLRRSLAMSLVEYLRANNHVHQGFDLMMGHWHRTVSPSDFLLTPIPCFVDHLGDDSTLIDGRPNRNVVGRFQGFAGEDYVYNG